MADQYLIQNIRTGDFLESYRNAIDGALFEVFWTKERAKARVFNVAPEDLWKLKFSISLLEEDKGGAKDVVITTPKSPMLGTPAVFTPAVFTPPVKMLQRYVTLTASYVGTELSLGGPCLDTLVNEALSNGATLHGPQYFAAGFFRQCVIYSEPAP